MGNYETESGGNRDESRVYRQNQELTDIIGNWELGVYRRDQELTGGIGSKQLVSGFNRQNWVSTDRIGCQLTE